MRRILFACACLLMMTIVPARVGAQSVALSLRAGTQGLGAGLNTNLANNLNGRVGVHFFNYGTDGEEDIDDTRVAYDADATLLFIAALVDWHPFSNGFRMTGGVHYNGFEASSDVVPLENIQAGNNSYTPEQVGTLGATIGFKSTIAPYIGIGTGNAINSRLGFLFDVGVLYAGEPEVDIRATGMLAPTAEEAPKVEDNLSWAQWYPVISLGFSYRISGRR